MNTSEHRLGTYILDGKIQIRCDDMVVWGEFLKQPARVVGKTTVGERDVSTVFLGIDHQWGDGPPILFETMIFPECEYQTRCSTWEEAEEMHKRAVDFLTLEIEAP